MLFSGYSTSTDHDLEINVLSMKRKKENDSLEKFNSFTYFFLAQQIYIYDPSSASIFPLWHTGLQVIS